jgi:transcriptional antiterminator RfaH
MDAEPIIGEWAAAATHPHREALASENLARQGFKSYCPVIMRRVRHARRTYDSAKPLFPGYIFIELKNWPAQLRPLLSTVGIRTLVMSGKRPATLPAGFVENLKAREIDGRIARPELAFQIGQTVTIQNGPLDGLIGQIVELRENDRVLILLDLLKRATRVSVDARQLV